MISIRDGEVLEDYDLDPLSTEDKLVSAHEGPIELAPWEITEIVEDAMSNLPRDFDVEQTDIIFDVIYDAVTEALNHRRVQI